MNVSGTNEQAFEALIEKALVALPWRNANKQVRRTWTNNSLRPTNIIGDSPRT